MATIHQPADIAADRLLRLDRVTPRWIELLEQAAAERGLPPEPWPLP
jgi:hypothetical protein